MGSAAKDTHDKLHDIAGKAHAAMPSSVDQAATQAGDSLRRVRERTRGNPRRNDVAVGALILALVVLWRWTR